MLSGQYNKRVTVERSLTYTGQDGPVEGWLAFQELSAQVNYLTDSVKKENQTQRQVHVEWVVRTRTQLNITKNINLFRIKVVQDGQTLYLHPLTFPLKKGDEWRIECYEGREEETRTPPPSGPTPQPIPERYPVYDDEGY